MSRSDLVADRLRRLIEPADLFLDLQAYGSDHGRVDRFLSNVAVPEVEIRQTVQAQQLQVNANVNGALVQGPLLSNRSFVAPVQDLAYGIPGLALSAPIPAGDVAKGESAAPVGAVVGYLDLRAVPDLLRPLARPGYRVTLIDAAEAEVAVVGEWPEDLSEDRRLVVERDLAVADDAARLGAARSKEAGGDPTGSWRLRVEFDRGIVDAVAGGLRSRTGLWTALAVMLAIAFGLGAAGWIARPLRKLGDAADRLGRGERSARAGLRRSDEIGQLAMRFDQMASTLERLDAAKDDFVRTVSHELRTPLTSMRMSIANMLDGLVGPIEQGPRGALERVRVDLDRLHRTVDDLLRLTRLDVGLDVESHAIIDSCDLRGAVEHCIAMLEPLAADRRRVIEREYRASDGPVRIGAGGDLVQRVLTNIIDNAIRYADPDRAEEPIRVELVGDGVRPGVEVTNPGGGLDRAAHFAAYQQGEGSRDGLGLGLSIVLRLLAHCGGELDVATEHDEARRATTRVRITFPALRRSGAEPQGMR